MFKYLRRSFTLIVPSLMNILELRKYIILFTERAALLFSNPYPDRLAESETHGTPTTPSNFLSSDRAKLKQGFLTSLAAYLG